ncbi:MAG: PKD domain-containing protein [Chloroflexota bacterium]|nr:PKD domain-containing protein [Chloroflexota bacterium]
MHRSKALLTLPDLNVRFIESTPAYEYDGKQKWPDPGDTVAFTAHIANRGTVDIGSFAYSWSIDGVIQEQSTHPGLSVGEEDSLTVSWTWELGTHTVMVSLDPTDAITEVSESNNTITDRTDALALGIWVEQSFYDFFNANVITAGWGGNSYDDWIQRHVQIWNDMLATAGMLDRVRAAKIVVVPDGGLNCNTNRPTVDSTVDLMWGFPSEQVGVPSPANCTWWTPRYRDDPSTWDRDMGLIHELNHARYHIDLYGFNMYIHARPLADSIDAGAQTLRLTDPPDFVEFAPPVYFAMDGELLYCTARDGDTFNDCTRGIEGTTARAHNSDAAVYAATVRVQDGLGNVLVGTEALPVNGANGAMVYLEPYYYEDIMDSGSGYGEYSAYVWNRIAGQRARCGNYNAPCNIGEFLDEIPTRNILEVRWPDGQPVPDAAVEIYQAQSYPIWYGKQYVNTPDVWLVTDENGQAELGAFPFSNSEHIVHGWNHSNGVLLLKVAAEGLVSVQFLDVTAFNLAYWKGVTNPTYPITLTHSMTVDVSPPQVTFAATPRQGHLSLSATFVPNSTGGAITHYLWDFGDGTTSALASPMHMYEQPGVYTVTLTVSGPGGGDRVTMPSYIEVDIPYSVYLPLVLRNHAGGTVSSIDSLVVAQGSANSVSVVNAETGTPLHTPISVGQFPMWLTGTPGDNRIFVANEYSDSVSIMDQQTYTVLDTISVGDGPRCIAVASDLQRGYTVNNGSCDVSVIDLQTNGVIATLAVGAHPEAIAISSNTGLAYVVANTPGKIVLIDTSTNQVADWFHIGRQPQAVVAIATSPSGQYLYVVDSLGRALYTVDASSYQIVDFLAIPGLPHRILVTSDGSKAYIANYARNQLSVVDLSEHRVIEDIDVQASQWAMDVSEDGSQLFVPLYDSDEIVAIDTATDTVVRRFVLSGHPTAVYLIE